MKNFEIKGAFVEKSSEKKFTVRLDAVNENAARQKAFSTIGSRHKVKRIHMSIESVKETAGENIGKD